MPPEDTSIYKECAKDKLPKEVVQYLGTEPVHRIDASENYGSLRKK